MTPCKLCSTPTNSVYNIKFKAVPVCEDCGRSIFLQQAQWYAKQEFMVSNDERTLLDLYNYFREADNIKVSMRLFNIIGTHAKDIDKPLAKIRKEDLTCYKNFGSKCWDEFIFHRSAFLKTTI